MSRKKKPDPSSTAKEEPLFPSKEAEDAYWLTVAEPFGGVVTDVVRDLDKEPRDD